MKEFSYTIKDPLGIHARPAGLLVKEAMQFKADILIDRGDKKADAKRIMAVMSLGIKQGSTVVVCCDGEGEEEACTMMQKFFKQNL